MTKEKLINLYVDKRYSVSQISEHLSIPQSTVNYWIRKYGIAKRTISDAQYLRHNPKGDPFSKIEIKTISQAFLFGLGIGLYWGEGTKSNKTSVRLGNTNPKLVKRFIDFLIDIYQIDSKKLRFGLQIFNDSDKDASVKFWIKYLKINPSQLQKPVVSEIRGKGTYSKKSQYGVLTVYFNNTKLRNEICGEIEKL